MNPVDNATQSYTGINCGALTDGTVTLTVEVTDTSGNLTTYAGTDPELTRALELLAP